MNHNITQKSSIRILYVFTSCLSLILAALAALIGFVVLISWKADFQKFIQLTPQLVPMQFNTALLLTLSGLALLGASNRWILYTFAACIFLFSSLTLLQYYFGFNFYIDELFHNAQITTRTAHPGRMAPNTAFCYMLNGAALLLMNWKTSKYYDWLSITLVSITFFIALVSTMGYILGLEEAYGWSNLSDMSPLTSLGFILIGLSVLFTALKIGERRHLPTWVLLSVLPGFYIGIIVIWRSFETSIFSLEKSQHTTALSNFWILFVIILLFFLALFIQKLAMSRIFKIDSHLQSLNKKFLHQELMLSYVNHELRNSLNAITGFSEVFIKNSPEPLSEKVHSSFQSIYLSSTHIVGVLNDLLAISCLQNGTLQLSNRHFDVKDWIDQTTAPLKLKADQQSIVLNVKITPFVPSTLKSDPQKLSQIIKNLVENSFKYTSIGETVTITLDYLQHSQSEDEFIIIVDDTGQGILPSKLDVIFDPYVQADLKDTKHGIGLGLAICKNYIETMGGTISVQSKLGVGSSFTCVLKIKK